VSIYINMLVELGITVGVIYYLSVCCITGYWIYRTEIENVRIDDSDDEWVIDQI
jgi:hypothetical protein